MHDARAISNLILAKFDAKSFDISNLKLNKVLYFVHGMHLANTATGIVRNHFEAWEHGPVVRVVYHQFKEFGEDPITNAAEHLNYATGKVEPISFRDIQAETREFILQVAEHYVHFPAWKLREMTHEPGGPWQQVFASEASNRGLRDRIPNELIRAHFVSRFRRSH
jgi:uncharacterized phage-associated protein